VASSFDNAAYNARYGNHSINLAVNFAISMPSIFAHCWSGG